jgi:hypothetical protein
VFTYGGIGLKGQCHGIFCFRFFHKASPPKPLKITFGTFFSKIRGDIRMSRCTTGINDTDGKFAAGVEVENLVAPSLSLSNTCGIPGAYFFKIKTMFRISKKD